MTKCDLCSNLMPEDLGPSPTGRHISRFLSISDLKESKKSCAECALVWNALSCFKTSWDENEDIQMLELRMIMGEALLLNWGRVGLFLEVFSNAAVSNVNSLPQTVGPVTEVSRLSSSDTCFQFASSWLQKCVETHSTCQSEPTPSPLPTRVLNVGREGTQDPFLLETNGIAGHYAALTYCWGSPKEHQVLKTTVSNIEDHKKHIAFDSLPNTLRDAVTITRRLGLKYLWIDALCIIQGDHSDWVQECGKMCDVYSNAYLTISADHSSGTSTGIFAEQSFGNHTREIQYKDSVVYIRNQLRREHSYSPIQRISHNPEPINRRAWTLQESLLSPRILRYRSSEISWQCNESRACECGAGNKTIKEDETSYRFNRRPEVLEKLSLEQIDRRWYDVVEFFSERQLGVEGDRLPALSGLARKFAGIYQAAGEANEYLAGMWRSNLVKSLLWAVEDDFYRDGRDGEVVCRRPEKWRAPSWSWVSVEGPVSIAPLRNFQACVEVVEVKCVQSSGDPYGEVRSGKLALRGRVIHGVEVKVEEREDGDNYRGFSGGKWFTVHHREKTRAFLYDESDVVLDLMGIVSCLFVGTIESESMSACDEFFLVLRRRDVEVGVTEQVDGGTFERVGVSLRGSLTKRNTNSNNSSTSVGSLFELAKEELLTII